MNRYFIEIDSKKYEEYGEIDIISPPMQGELLDAQFAQKVKGGFEIHRPEYLCRFIRTVGGQRGAVAEYLIRKKGSQNKVLATNRELAAQTGVSLATVNTLLQELDRVDCIKRRTGAVMVNPGVGHRGNRQREAYLMKLYGNFSHSD